MSILTSDCDTGSFIKESSWLSEATDSVSLYHLFYKFGLDRFKFTYQYGHRIIQRSKISGNWSIRSYTLQGKYRKAPGHKEEHSSCQPGKVVKTFLDKQSSSSERWKLLVWWMCMKCFAYAYSSLKRMSDVL